MALSHLQRLEAESDPHLPRGGGGDGAAGHALFGGKDSSVMLHLARKAFHPGAAAFPFAARRHDVEVPRRCTRFATAPRREAGWS